MDAASYTSLTRQSGLKQEMQAIANNIANISTAGYRREGLIFAEHVAALDAGEPSLSMARAHGRHVDTGQGVLTATGGQFDFAIEGPGFFLIEAPEGQMLTRAGAFTPNPEGELVTPDGARLLDAGGAPIFVPQGIGDIALAADGTVSADGLPLAQIGLYEPADPASLSRQQGARFAADGELLPVENSVILQGFIEGSNVDAVSEVARMIEVQHAYQMGQSFLEKEDERIRSVVQTLGK